MLDFKDKGRAKNGLPLTNVVKSCVNFPRASLRIPPNGKTRVDPGHAPPFQSLALDIHQMYQNKHLSSTN